MALKAVQELQHSIQCIKDEYPELMEKVNNAFFEEKRAQLFIELIIFEKNTKEILEDINKNGIRERVVSGETEYEKLCSAFFEILFQYKYEEVLVLLELFTDENSGLGLEDGLEILECDGLSMEKDGNSVKLQTLGSGGGRLELSLRSGGKDANEQK